MRQQSVVCEPEGFETQNHECEMQGMPGYSLCPPHRVEAEVLRTLRETPGVHVESLSIHRLDNESVCLHGVLELDDMSTDVESVIRRALSIDHVVNRMVVKYGPTTMCPVPEVEQSYL